MDPHRLQCEVRMKCSLEWRLAALPQRIQAAAARNTLLKRKENRYCFYCTWALLHEHITVCCIAVVNGKADIPARSPTPLCTKLWPKGYLDIPPCLPPCTARQIIKPLWTKYTLLCTIAPLQRVMIFSSESIAGVGPTRIYGSYLDHSLTRSDYTLHFSHYMGEGWRGRPANSFHVEYVNSKWQRFVRHLS